MPFRWEDYLTLAEELAARHGDEAAGRSAISRAHYAALGRASELLRSEGRTVSQLRTHSDVWRAFQHSSDVRRTAVSRHLNALRQLRNTADYDPSFDDDLTAAADDAAGLSRRVLDILDDIRSAPA